jgi:predicted SPOUT superfamily RNA methylase MTH1
MFVCCRRIEMVRGKRRNGVWHHRVPDFKLVYCGQDKYITKKETKLTINERKGKLSAMVDEVDVSNSRLTEQKH